MGGGCISTILLSTIYAIQVAGGCIYGGVCISTILLSTIYAIQVGGVYILYREGCIYYTGGG